MEKYEKTMIVRKSSRVFAEAEEKRRTVKKRKVKEEICQFVLIV